MAGTGTLAKRRAGPQEPAPASCAPRSSIEAEEDAPPPRITRGPRVHLGDRAAWRRAV